MSFKKKILIIFLICMLCFIPEFKVYAHGGNITGWKDKNSSKIVKNNEKYYGYHKEDGKIHYHQVEWNNASNKWVIVNPAVYYDENFNVVENNSIVEDKKIEVEYDSSVDGDTAKFKLNDKIIKVRFLGIDTPETVHTQKEEQPYGKEASNYTKEKLENANKIEIEYDVNAQKQDKYNRELAWIWVDGNLLQEELVLNGLAKTYMLQNNYKYASVLQIAETKAQEEKINIWSQEQTTNTLNENFQENVKNVANENMNNITDSSRNNDKNDLWSNAIIIVFVILILFINIFKKRK